MFSNLLSSVFKLQTLIFVSLLQNIQAGEFAPNIQHEYSTGDENIVVSWINMDEDEDYILDVTPIATYEVETKQDCAIRCTIMAGTCMSTNLIGSSTCQILDTDKYRNYTQFKPQVGSTHYPIATECSEIEACPDESICIPYYTNNTYQCICTNGELIEDNCAPPPTTTPPPPPAATTTPPPPSATTTTCSHITNGIALIQVNQTYTTEVHCTEGYTDICIRKQPTEETVSFDKLWADYKHGFGSPDGEYWLGNDIISQLTLGGVPAQFELTTFSNNGNKRVATYENFEVRDETTEYRLEIDGFDDVLGPIKDGMLHSKQKSQAFSTSDNDNDRSTGENCATKNMGGWWYESCNNEETLVSKVTGRHFTQQAVNEPHTGIQWYGISVSDGALKGARMSILLP